MNIELKLDDKVMLRATAENDRSAVTVDFIAPEMEATIKQWLSEDTYVYSHGIEGDGLSGVTNGLDDVRAFEQKLLGLVRDLGDGWTMDVTGDETLKLAKHLQGQHDQADHNPHEGGATGETKPDINQETTTTEIPDHLKTFQGVKEHLMQGTKVIISAERPHFKPDDNARRNIGLKRLLQNFSEDVVAQEGQWGGSKETSYVATVSDDDLKTLRDLAFSRGELDQEAIIVLRGGAASLEFRDGSKMTGSIADLQDVAGENDNFSRLGGVKYRINFKDKE